MRIIHELWDIVSIIKYIKDNMWLMERSKHEIWRDGKMLLTHFELNVMIDDVLPVP